MRTVSSVVVLLGLGYLLTTVGPDGAGTAQGATYYVAPSGKDSNPGSETQPWQTIQKAASALVAGDTVLVRSGTYRERVLPVNSGTADQQIVYAAYPGEVATLDGTGVPMPDDLAGLFGVTGGSHLRISGLRIINVGPYNDNAGILVRNSHFVTVQNNCTSNTVSSGIGVWESDHVALVGNTVDLACTRGWQEAISVAITDTFEVRENRISDSQKEGICIKQGSSNGRITLNQIKLAKVGIYVDAWDRRTWNLEVSANKAWDCSANGFGLSSEMGGLLQNVLVHENLAYHNRFIGLVISTYGPGGLKGEHPMNGLTVINNTFSRNGWDWGGGMAVDNKDALNVVVRNNICSQNLSFQLTVASVVSLESQQIAIDHNLIDGFRGNPEGETYGLACVKGDPRFVNPTAADFHLKATSPAIDAGTNQPALVATTDLDGQPRVVGGRVDMGAYEFQGAGGVIPEVWLRQYGLPTDGSAAYTDADGDGLNNWQEWRCGTNPTNALSVLRLVPPLPVGTEVTVGWQSVAGVNYFLDRSTNLTATPRFTPLATNLMGLTGTTTYIDTNGGAALCVFYRLGVGN